MLEASPFGRQNNGWFQDVNPLNALLGWPLGPRGFVHLAAVKGGSNQGLLFHVCLLGNVSFHVLLLGAGLRPGLALRVDYRSDPDRASYCRRRAFVPKSSRISCVHPRSSHPLPQFSPGKGEMVTDPAAGKHQ